MNAKIITATILHLAEKRPLELNDFAEKLISYLKKSNKLDLLKNIKSLLKKELLKKSNITEIRIAKEIPSENIKEILKKELSGKETNVKVTVDKSLIGGYIIDEIEQRIDRSYKGKLYNLFLELSKIN